MRRTAPRLLWLLPVVAALIGPVVVLWPAGEPAVKPQAPAPAVASIATGQAPAAADPAPAAVPQDRADGRR